MKTELEKKYEELVKEYKRLINLSASKQFFDIPYVRSLESEIAALKQQGQVTDEMIEKWAYDETEQNICGDFENGLARGKELGAKAMRDNLIKPE